MRHPDDANWNELIRRLESDAPQAPGARYDLPDLGENGTAHAAAEALLRAATPMDMTDSEIDRIVYRYASEYVQVAGLSNGRATLRTESDSPQLSLIAEDHGASSEHPPLGESRSARHPWVQRLAAAFSRHDSKLVAATLFLVASVVLGVHVRTIRATEASQIQDTCSVHYYYLTQAYKNHRYEDVVLLYGRLDQMGREVVNRLNPSTWMDLENCTWLSLVEMGQHQRAESIYQRNFERILNFYGPTHVRTQECLQRIIESCHAMNTPEKARQYQKLVDEAILSSDHGEYKQPISLDPSYDLSFQA